MIRTKKFVSLDSFGDLLSLAACWRFIPSLFPMLSLFEIVNSHLPSPIADQLNSSYHLLGDDKGPTSEVLL